MKRSNLATPTSASRRRRRHLAPTVDAMEPRLLLTAGVKARLLAGDGVDSLALGDVNGDQVADFAVASHHSGRTNVTIYSGWGQSADTTTGYAPLALVSLDDPLGPNSGPLDVALGDFDGDGVSELAVSSATGRPIVATWKFQVVGTSPVNATVTASPLTSPFAPRGYAGPGGLELASADLDGDGKAELLVGKAGASDRERPVTSYGFQASTVWQVEKVYTGTPIATKAGVSLDAGDVTGDGVPDVAVASKARGKVAVFDGALGRWDWTVSPFRSRPGSARVAIVSSENQAGSLVVTGQQGRNTALAAIVPYAGGSAVMIQPAASPGSGALVPLGAGYVYQRSTVQNPTSAFPTSPGPITPTVLFGSTSGAQLIVQGFDPKLEASKADTYVQPLWGAVGQGFWPLQARQDPATGLSPTEKVPTSLIVYPEIAYTSPYSIDLSKAPKSIYNGLSPYATIANTSIDGWGPDKVANTPPSVPEGASNDWLRERVLAVYMSAIGVDYQHHHDPRWLPSQGSEWNVAGTVSYQSQGIDCTNFTAWAYSDALGITMNSATGEQAAISPQNPNGTIIPKELADRVEIQTITHWKGYDDLVGQLMPGDILIINGDPSDRSKATHGITWLGDYGKDVTGKDENLIIDATGITPSHVDSFNHVVPEGVHIRPFGAPGTINDWYYKNVSHVLRFIKDDRTALVSIAGSALPLAPGEDPKPLAEDKHVESLLTLRRRPDGANRESLESLALKPLSERAYLSRSEFAARYGADPSDIEAVRRWAATQGLEVSDVDIASRTVRLAGKVSDANHAFGVRLESGTQASGNWSYKGEIEIPRSLKDVIQGVFSVSPRANDLSSDSTGVSASGVEDEAEHKYTPAQVADRFDFPDGDGEGQAIGVIELNGKLDDKARDDFRVYFESLGIPLPEIISVGTGTPSSANEMFLDLEVIGALVPKAKIVSYFAPSTPGDFYETVMDAVHDAEHKIGVLSISYSFPEAYLSPMYMDVANEAFLEAAAMGVSAFASAGDYGSSRGIADGLAHMEFPATSPWVTAVGGTSIKRGDPISDEKVWDDYTIENGYLIGAKGSTGGGVSSHFDVPNYQRDAGLDPRSVNPGHERGRGGPDVASIADPHTGIYIRGHGEFLYDGGTSAAAPVWAALAVRLNEQMGKNLGFFNTLLYGDLRDKDVVHDVIHGDNVSSHIDLEGNQIPTYLGYHAEVGWDMTTGWGTPKGKSLLAELKKLLARRPG